MGKFKNKSMNFSKKILLTGAGFTANFGGLLAKTIGREIFSNPQIDSMASVKEKLGNDGKFDFETIYSNLYLENSTYTSSFQKMIKEAFINMDKKMQFPSSDKLNLFTPLRAFLNLFEGNGRETGLFFTLNQDLLIERFIQNPWIPIGFSGTGTKYLEYVEAITTGSISPEREWPMPNHNFVEEIKSKYLNSMNNSWYIKLHGSLCWDTIVLGANKFEVIANDPLLGWYLQTFHDALKGPDAKILVVGYSFSDGDGHITARLQEAAKENNLKIYVVTPDVEKLIKSFEHGMYPNFPKYISGYFPPEEILIDDLSVRNQSTLWKIFRN